MNLIILQVCKTYKWNLDLDFYNSHKSNNYNKTVNKNGSTTPTEQLIITVVLTLLVAIYHFSSVKSNSVTVLTARH